MADIDENVLEHLNYVFYSDLKLCGCGDPASAWQLIHGLLKLAPFYEDQRWKQARELIGSDGAKHIVLSAMTDADLLEHGGSIGGSWATDKGRWVLWAIDEAGGPEDLDTRVDEVGYPHEGQGCSDTCWKVAGGG